MNARKAIVTLSVLLGLSVCGNAFLGGLVLSQGPLPPPGLMGENPRRGMDDGRAEGRGGPDGRVREFMHAMPPEVRQPMMEALRNDRDNRETFIKNIHDARAKAITALKAEPFDIEALRAALVAQRGAQAATQEHMHELLIGVIEKLTPEQRQQLASSAQRLFK